MLPQIFICDSREGQILQLAKIVVHSNVTPCHLVDVNISEEIAASVVQIDESVFRQESAGVCFLRKDKLNQ
jgi:hypothetical protein